MKFTLQSLKGQTTQDFLTLIQYADSTEQLVNTTVNKYDPLPGNIQFVRRSEYENIIADNIKGYDDLYLVRLDVDDMYIESFIQQLMDFHPKEGTLALINQRGYLYDSVQNRLAYIKRKSPPFYTLIYKVKDYLAGYRHRIPGKGGHGSVIRLSHEKIRNTNFMIVVHSMNTVNAFLLSKRRGDYVIEQDKIQEILKQFINNS